MPYLEQKAPREPSLIFTSVLLWIIYIYYSRYLSLRSVHKETVMELKGYRGSSDRVWSVLLCHFETTLRAAAMGIMTGCTVTGAHISIVFYSVANHDSKGTQRKRFRTQFLLFGNKPTSGEFIAEKAEVSSL